MADAPGKLTIDAALSGIRVVEQGTFITGPCAGMMLADLGARVIKVEKPDTGDDSRSYGPFVGEQVDLPPGGVAEGRRDGRDRGRELRGGQWIGARAAGWWGHPGILPMRIVVIPPTATPSPSQEP